MEKRIGKNNRVIWMLKALLTSYVITAAALLILALLLYQFDLDEQKVTMGILVIYVLSTFVGGWILGKLVGERRFFWGLMLGFVYFGLLLAVSAAVNHSLQSSGMNIFTILLLCTGGGMLGGMVS